MADYRELLRRAVDALPENNGTARRAVYEKARSALVTQLRAIDPPLPAREITQHRLTLEDCIRQVEQEATEVLLRGLRHDDEPQPPVVPVSEPVAPAQSEPEEEPDAQETVSGEAQEEGQSTLSDTPPSFAEPEPEIAEADADRAAEPIDDMLAPAVEDDDDAFVAAAPVAAVEAEDAEVTPTVEKPTPDVSEQPDDASIDADDAAPTKNAEEPSKDTDAETATIDDDTRSGRPAPTVTAEPQADTAVPSVSAMPSAGDAGVEKSTENRAPSVADVIATARASSPSKAETPNVSEVENTATADVSPALSKVVEVEVEEPGNETNTDGEEPQATIDRALKALDLEAEGKDGSGLIEKHDAKEADPKATKVEDDSVVVEDEQVGGNGLTVFVVIALLLLGGATGGAYWAWNAGYVDLGPIVQQLGLTASAPDAREPTPTETSDDRSTNTDDQVPAQANVRDVTPASQSNGNADTGSDRLTPEPVAPPQEPTATALNTNETETAVAGASEDIGAETTPTETADVADTRDRLQAEAPANTNAEPVLNTEDTSTQPTQVGSRSMLIEEQLTGSGGAVPFTGETTWSRGVDELGVPTIKANVSIPARNLSVDILLRKNGDRALPASHLIEVDFSVTESFLGGGIASMPGILLKNEELAQGNPLVGASARIFDNLFLFALSAAESDLATNLKMLSERGWIDLPVVYSTGRKAIVTIEKGTDGAEIFESVLAAWSEAQ